MGDFRSLKVWERAHALTLAVYQATAGFPSQEMYGLTSQIRRAAASIPANIAEGSGRNTQKEFARFCRIALGSANELEYHLLLARDLGFLPTAVYQPLQEDVRRVRSMLARLLPTLSTDDR